MQIYQLFKLIHRPESTRLSGLFSHRFSTSTSSSKTHKKNSQYGTVDTERYSSLVKAVVSSRTSAHTPESLEEQDCHLYGPVVKSKPPQKPAPKRPKNFHPLLNHAKPGEYEQGPLARITLQRGPGKSTAPSVTRILQQTMPAMQAFYLERWRRRMIAELGEEGFKEYSLNLFRQGKLFHTSLEGVLTLEEDAGEEADCPEDAAGYMESVRHVLDDVSEVRAIESAVEHQSLHYLGIVDCVALYRGSLCVIDWKTSEKPKPFLHNTYDNPLQVAAYIGALNNDDNYRYQVEHGLIVVAYKDGSPAHPHFLRSDQVMQYWEKWLLRLEGYVEK